MATEQMNVMVGNELRPATAKEQADILKQQQVTQTESAAIAAKAAARPKASDILAQIDKATTLDELKAAVRPLVEALSPGATPTS